LAKPLTLNLKITEKDLGLKNIRTEVAKLAKKPFVKVGYQGDKALEEKDGATGMNVVAVATIHEFGAANVPERSHIRKTINENESKYASVAEKLKDKILSGGMTTETALDVLGQVAQRDIQNTIRSNNAGLNGPTPLSPATLKARGATTGTPLYDTGQMVRSITYVKDLNGGTAGATEETVSL